MENTPLKVTLDTIKDFEPDIIITVGGGSVIDTAKAIALAITNPEKNNDIRLLSGINATNHRCLPIIALPTTCGTGTEVTQFFIITDEQNKQKMVCADVNSFPITAIVDSELMDGMPMNLASATGMDALTHAIEAYTSNSTNPITDMYALKAIKGIFENAEKAIINKEDEAKEVMALSQYLAGFSFANAGLGLVHAMAHQLGGVYDLPHGLCNALLLPHVIKYNGRFCGKRYKNILKEIGYDTSSRTNEEATDILASQVVELNEQQEITKPHGELGVKKEDLEMLAEKALKDPCIGYNIVKPTEDEIIDIYARSL